MKSSIGRRAVVCVLLVLLVGYSSSLAKPGKGKRPQRTTIADLVVASTQAAEPEFTILLDALQAADPAVLATLDGYGQFTVFAPTDEAFGNLLVELQVSAEDLLANQALLTKVLLYHVAHGRRYATDVLDSDRIRTLQGGFLLQDEGVLTDVNGRTSEITATDIEADNGIIHVIDKVVLPESEDDA
jgi:uncharacterized surface protein with fasciclin (FAS1) repeats